MTTEEEKIEEGVLLGDFGWQTTRNTLLFCLNKCKTEKDFVKLMIKIYKSMGTSEELAKRRKELGIHPFTEEDLDKIEKQER